MTEQEKREKVIKGLKCHVNGHPHTRCHKCPYWGTGPHGSSECNVLAADALALLKEQEPRLVTEKDFENADAYGYIPAWCETKDDLYCECIVVGALDEEGCRYWTSKPTKEQMEVTPWN